MRVVAATALVFLLVHLFLTFGLRTVTHRRRTGSSGFSGISGARGSVEWWGGVLFAGALVLALIGIPLTALGAIGVAGFLDTELARAAGAGLFWGGLVTTLIGQSAMGDSWRIGVDENDRTELVVRGPFEAVRNPIFAGMIPTAVGMVLMVPNPVVLVAALALIAALEIQTRLVEEPYLLRVHGPAYGDYAARVGRFFPLIGRLR